MSEVIHVEVPTVGESISEVQIGQWLKAEGDWVAAGQDLVEIETEKATVQIPAPVSGFLEKIEKQEEDFANVGDVIASIRPAEQPAGDTAEQTSGDPAEPPTADADKPPAGVASDGPAGVANAPASPPSSLPPGAVAPTRTEAVPFVMPAAQRLLGKHGLTAAQVPATGPGGRLLKEDVLAFVRDQPPSSSAAEGGVTAKGGNSTAEQTSPRPTPPTSLIPDAAPHRSEEIKPLSMLRRTIAARLVEAQQTAALLTTFNEVDMQAVITIRKKYKDRFVERHGVKLGFMSFFAKAAVEALRRYPAVNAEIRGDDVIYRYYQDIGIAIGGGKGLVVPVLRSVERMSFADIELGISEFARQAEENRLQPADLMGGTFTISNGGIYGSMLSTPIVNPPQSGILGLHTITERPVAIDGNVVIRPMMYVALSYDHRIVDGREAVGFLKTIKEVIEDPARLFLEL